MVLICDRRFCTSYESFKMPKSYPLNVLFLCTGNSARSIICEAILNDVGNGKFSAWSAGSNPSAKPHPDALTELLSRGHSIDHYCSKSWNELKAGPEMDIVITVCNNAAAESCPIFPGKSIKIHWPAADPVSVSDQGLRSIAFRKVYDMFYSYITKLVSLPREELNDETILQNICDSGI